MPDRAGPSRQPPVLVADLDYELPPELIAQRPLPRRSDSRMMVVERATGRIEHGLFRDLPDLMASGDVMVLNATKVFPARAFGLLGDRRVEFLFLKETAPNVWEALCRPARRVRPGDVVRFGPDLSGRVVGVGEEGRRSLRFEGPDVRSRLRRVGFAPLPPYIKRERQEGPGRLFDLKRYQTVYARAEGSIAAPTAGLHFTRAVLEALRRKGVRVRSVTLDVGLATFQPVRVARLEDHRMLEESYRVPASTAAEIDRAKAEGQPVTAVGTTVVRALESAWRDGGVRPGPGSTSLFLRPGSTFHVVDRLLTNFHLPRSTLLALVAAFAGYDLTMRAYREAVRERYRFFSYGDCMLIL